MAYIALAFQAALYIFGTLLLLCLSLCALDGIVAKVRKLRRQWSR